MKIKILICLALFSLFSCTPNLIAFNDNESLVDVYKISGTKNELYVKANDWFIKSFLRASSVIQFSDKEEGVVIGKFILHSGVSDTKHGDGNIYAIVDIRVKDDKVRIEIQPQGNWKYDPSGMTLNNYKKQDAVNDITAISDSFHAAMQKPPKEF